MELSPTTSTNLETALTDEAAPEAQAAAAVQEAQEAAPLDIVVAGAPQVDGTLFIPDDVLTELFIRYFEGPDFVNCANVCKRWSGIVRSLQEYPLVRSLTLVNSCMSRMEHCSVIGFGVFESFWSKISSECTRYDRC